MERYTLLQSCPKCGYIEREHDGQGAADETCPKCGLVGKDQFGCEFDWSCKGQLHQPAAPDHAAPQDTERAGVPEPFVDWRVGASDTVIEYVEALRARVEEMARERDEAQSVCRTHAAHYERARERRKQAESSLAAAYRAVRDANRAFPCSEPAHGPCPYCNWRDQHSAIIAAARTKGE